MKTSALRTTVPCQNLLTNTFIIFCVFEMIFVNIIDAGCARHIVGNLQLITMFWTKGETTTYGELVRYPLRVDIKIRMVSYWANFIDGKQSKLPNILYKLCLALSYIEGKNFGYLMSKVF